MTIFSIFVLLVAGVIYFVFYSHFFLVAAVEVSGSVRAEEIKDALSNNLAETSKIRYLLGSDNLLFWPPKAMGQIPSSLYWLEDIKIKKDWQQKKIIIEAKERRPWLLWCLQTRTNADNVPRQSAIKKCYWVDEQGVVFSPASEAEGFIVPKVFEEDGRQQLILSQSFYDNPQLVKNTLEIIKQIKKSSLAVNRFLVSNADLQEMETETGKLKLYFSLRFLPQNLNKILIDLAGRLDFPKLEYVDFRVENRIYYK